MENDFIMIPDLSKEWITIAKKEGTQSLTQDILDMDEYRDERPMADEDGSYSDKVGRICLREGGCWRIGTVD